MGQTGDAHQVGEVLRLGVDEHLHGEIRAELRHTQSPQFAAADVLRLDSQGAGVLEQTHHLRGIQGDVLARIQTG